MNPFLGVICPYCNQGAKLVTGATIYPHRPDLYQKYFWQCEPCDAFVGTHVNSARHHPLGRLANAELQRYEFGWSSWQSIQAQKTAEETGIDPPAFKILWWHRVLYRLYKFARKYA